MEAAVRGDPHVTTFDGLIVTYKDCGDFDVALGTKTGFAMQARFCSKTSQQVTSTCAIAVRCSSNSDVVEVYAQKSSTRVRAGGMNITATSGRVGLVGALIAVSSNKYIVQCASNGPKVVVYIKPYAGAWSIDAVLLPGTAANTWRGLFGSPNANVKDELKFRNGTTVAGVDISRGYVNGITSRPIQSQLRSWRVQTGENMFDLSAGQSESACSSSKAIDLSDEGKTAVAASECGLIKEAKASEANWNMCIAECILTGDMCKSAIHGLFTDDLD